MMISRRIFIGDVVRWNVGRRIPRGIVVGEVINHTTGARRLRVSAPGPGRRPYELDLEETELTLLERPSPR